MSKPFDMMLRGVKPVDAAGVGDAVDVLVREGAVVRMGAGLPEAEGVEEVKAEGSILLPGFFDLDVHLREPGREDQEDFVSGSSAAAQGGITGMLAMPNTDPPVDTGGMVQNVRDLAEARACISILTAGCLTVGREGQSLAAIGEMAERGVRLLTDDPSPVENPQVLRRAMEYARDFGLIVASHPTTPALLRSGAMNEGEMSYYLGLPGMPAIAEEIAIGRDIALARHTGCRLHLQHISTRRGMDMVRRAKEEGVAVTCEVTPHHLVFDESAVGDYDTRFKMDPPLRTDDDREALLEAVRDGTADVLVSNHAPHSTFEKQVDFAGAPFGVSALDTMLPMIWHHLVAPGKLDWATVVRAYAVAPRKLLGLEPPALREGVLFDAVLFDPDGQTEVTPGWLRSKGTNNTFLGERLRGRVRMTVAAGKPWNVGAPPGC